jgi:hypothetical protein
MAATWLSGALEPAPWDFGTPVGTAQHLHGRFDKAVSQSDVAMVRQGGPSSPLVLLARLGVAAARDCIAGVDPAAAFSDLAPTTHGVIAPAANPPGLINGAIPMLAQIGFTSQAMMMRAGRSHIQ